jgi:SMI1-KNR4 cell-wall
MTDLDDLIAIAPPPPDPAPPIDWDAAGIRFPADYVALAERYGAGTFDDGITVLVPGHPNRHLELVRYADEARSAMRTLRDEGEDMPHDPDELLAWAADDGGNFIWWHMADPSAPDSWPVVVSEARGDEWLRFEGGAVAFLAALLSGRFPNDFLVVDDSGSTTFTRHPAS